MQFCYYRYFAERAQEGLPPLVLGGLEPPKEFIEKVIEFHRDSIPYGDSFRQEIERKDGEGTPKIGVGTIRAHLSKLNSILRRQLNDSDPYEKIKIQISGKRGAREYALRLPTDEIRVLSVKVYPRFKKTVVAFRPDEPLLAALSVMQKKDFHQVVVLSNGKPRLLTTEGIARWMSNNVKKGCVNVQDVEIRDVLPFEREDTLVLFKKDQTVLEAREVLSNSIKNNIPHVYAILIVDSYNSPKKLFGIITPWDFLDRQYW